MQIREYRDTRHALDAVARGEADAYAGNRSVALYIIGQEVISNLEIHGRLRKNSAILSSYLRNYHFDILKIDREFVSDIVKNKSDHEMASATIAMAHNLGLKVIAEGVETKEQLARLASQGCDFAQGYLFSKPLPPEEISILLETKQLSPYIQQDSLNES